MTMSSQGHSTLTSDERLGINLLLSIRDDLVARKKPAFYLDIAIISRAQNEIGTAERALLFHKDKALPFRPDNCL